MNARGEAEEGLEGGHRSPPPVEAKGEFIEVGLEMIVPDPMVGAAEPRLEVAEDAMDVRHDLGGPLRGALRTGTMAIAHARKRSVGRPGVGQEEGARGHGSLHEARQRGRSESTR